MAPAYRLCGDRPVAGRQFTDRESFLKAFADALADKENHREELRVFVLYGIGGIGKTRLRKEIVRQLAGNQPKLPVAELNFETPSLREPDEALAYLRQTLAKGYGIDFRLFDIAFAIYWTKAHPATPMNRTTIPFFEDGSLLAHVVSIVSGAGAIGLVPGLAQFFRRSEQRLVEWWSKRKNEDLAALESQDAAEIRPQLARFWAEDIREHLGQTGGTVVVFIDTFEALTGTEQGEDRSYEAQQWVRELVSSLPEALWVIGGREKLRWDEIDRSRWGGCLNQHLVGGLDPADRERFLLACGITDQEIRQQIAAASEGVPFYLDLAVDTYEEIISKGERPAPTDFGSTKRELYDRFRLHLDDATRETLKLLAVPRFFDRELFRLMLAAFPTGYPATAFDRLCRFSFIRETASSGSFTMHKLMRDTQIEHADRDTVREVHNWLFGHYAQKLENLSIKDIIPAHAVALAEAFHHAKEAMSAEKLFDWFWPRANQFMDAGQWNVVEMLYRELSTLLEATLGPTHPTLATSLNTLAELLRMQGKYDEAESLYRQALEILVRRLGRNHPDTRLVQSNLDSVRSKRSNSQQTD